MTALTIADRLADFVCERRPPGLAEWLAHETKRLLLNQLKASAEAALQPEGRQLLMQAGQQAAPGRGVGRAQIWWSSQTATPEHAAACNRRLLGQLEFGDIHLPSLGQFTAGILPDLLARAEAGGHGGLQFLDALATGLEVDIACAALSGEPARAQLSAPKAPLSIGALAARCRLQQHDRAAAAAAMAALQPTAWHRAGDPGVAALEELGRSWRLREIALPCRPLPAHALAPVEAVLTLRRVAGARKLRTLRLGLSRAALRLLDAQETPASDGYGSDLRHCMAAAWQLGEFTTEERLPACRCDPDIQAVRACIEILREPDAAGLESCLLLAQFEDGSHEQILLDAFLGSPSQPLSDPQLSELFRSAADDLVLPRRAGEILHALWGMDLAPNVRSLTALLQRAG